MKFDDFLEISGEGDFTLKNVEPDSGIFEFESFFGDRIHMRRIPGAVNESIQPWVVLVNGEKVDIDNPSQLVTLNTIVTGLCSKSLQQVISQSKKSKKGTK